jgi:hypothetical protein
MAPFHTPKGVQAYDEIMLKDGHRLLEQWSHMNQKTVEIGEEMTFAAPDPVASDKVRHEMPAFVKAGISLYP